MGQFQTIEMVEQVREGNISLRAALSWHLTSNHYPPVDEAWIEICALLIERYNGGDTDLVYQVDRPIGNGSFRAEYLVQRYNLEAFMENDDGI